MPLTESQIERYARQIIVPGIGAAGQSRLCASRVAIYGEEEGRRIALLWTRALGCQTVAPATPADCVIVAGAGGLDPASWPPLTRASCPIVWYALAGTRISAGVVRLGEALPDVVPTDVRDSGSPSLHAIAACDAVASAVALILDWDDCELTFTVDLT